MTVLSYQRCLHINAIACSLQSLVAHVEDSGYCWGMGLFCNVLHFQLGGMLMPILEQKETFIRYVESIFKAGYMALDSFIWQIQRKKLTPAFSFRHIKDLYPIYWAKSIELVQRLSTESSISQPYPQDEKLRGYATIDFYDWAGRATLDIIGLATFGKDFGTLADPNSELNTTYRKVFQPSAGRRTAYLLKMLFPVWVAQLITPGFHREIEEAVASIKSLCIECIEDAEAKNLKPDGTEEVNLLSVALRSELFEASELVDQLLTFLAAGYETTAVTLTWLIYLLCKHQHVQEKLRAEIQNHFPGTIIQENVDYSNLDSMPYLNAVCNEALRFIPGIPLTFRSAVRDTVILGQTIPAGTKVVLSPWAVNRSPSHWGPTATVFDPERWMGSGEANKGGADDNFSFMTFTNGPRSCIGQGFAKAELKALVVAIVGSFHLRREGEGMEEPEMDHEVVVRPVGGMRVQIKRLGDT